VHRKDKGTTGPSAAPETHIGFCSLKALEFVAEGEKTRMTLKPDLRGALHKMIVEGLSMPAALKEKLKTVLTPKG
jgi:hypothetical protein